MLSFEQAETLKGIKVYNYLTKSIEDYSNVSEYIARYPAWREMLEKGLDEERFQNRNNGYCDDTVVMTPFPTMVLFHRTEDCPYENSQAAEQHMDEVIKHPEKNPQARKIKVFISIGHGTNQPVESHTFYVESEEELDSLFDGSFTIRPPRHAGVTMVKTDYLELEVSYEIVDPHKPLPRFCDWPGQPVNNLMFRDLVGVTNVGGRRRLGSLYDRKGELHHINTNVGSAAWHKLTREMLSRVATSTKPVPLPGGLYGVNPRIPGMIEERMKGEAMSRDVPIAHFLIAAVKNDHVVGIARNLTEAAMWTKGEMTPFELGRALATGMGGKTVNGYTFVRALQPIKLGMHVISLVRK